MKRTVNLLAVVALALIGARGAWADHIPSTIGVCNTDVVCEHHSPDEPAGTFSIDFPTHTGGGHEITLGQVDGTTFRWDKSAFVGPTFDTTKWWGFEANSEFDRYPLPWGDEVYSAKFVFQNTGHGRETLLLSTDRDPSNEIIYHFKMPTNQAVTQIDVDMSFNRLVQYSARGTDSDPWTGLSGSGQDPAGPLDTTIPVGLIDTSSGVAKFQIRMHGTTGPSFVSGDFKVLATAVPEPTGLLMLGVGMLPLLRRRRRA